LHAPVRVKVEARSLAEIRAVVPDEQAGRRSSDTNAKSEEHYYHSRSGGVKWVYSSRTLVTLFRLAGIASGVVSEELGGGEIAEGLMRPDSVVGVFPLTRVLVESGVPPENSCWCVLAV